MMKRTEDLIQIEMVQLDGGVVTGGCIPQTGPQLPIVPFGDPRDFGGKLN